MLIPKAKQDINKAENWRPITVGLILGRIFSSIFGGRIRRGTVQNLKYKRFTSENGCKINVEFLNSALDHSKKVKGGVYKIVDISRAFNSVPHLAIKPCRARKGISIPLIELIQNIYKKYKTRMQAKNGAMVEIEILREIKQGDPLSPLLFNLCVKLLLEATQMALESTIAIRSIY